MTSFAIAATNFVMNKKKKNVKIDPKSPHYARYRIKTTDLFHCSL